MTVNSYAKINIGLHILNKREDNFHNIITVFQEIDFCDQISIEKSDDKATRPIFELVLFLNFGFIIVDCIKKDFFIIKRFIINH